MDERFLAGERAALIPSYTQLADAAGAEADIDLLRSLGICLDAAGQYDRAVAWFRAVLAKDPRDSTARSRVIRWQASRVRKPAATLKPRRALPSAGTSSRARPKRALPSHDDAKRQFVELFPKAFKDPRYLEEERNYKWAAHELWQETLSRRVYERLLGRRDHDEICRRLRQVNSTLNLLSRFESAALGDVTKTSTGARLLATSIYELTYGAVDADPALDELVVGLQRLNIRGTSPAKWPIVTVFPFVADPGQHLFLKPVVTQRAADRFGFELNYRPEPNGATYRRAQQFAGVLSADLKPLRPRDNIDIQSFIWVTNREGYD